jgi:hypothetical protein
MRLRPHFFVALVLVFVLGTIHATTIIPPVNLAELCKDSDAVVLARVRASRVIGEEFFATRTSFVVEDVLRGALVQGDTFEVEVPGGVRGDEICIVHGSPSFEHDETYLLCLRRLAHAAEEVWVPRMSSYGLLKVSLGAAGDARLEPLREARFHALARPDGRAVEPVVSYRKAELIGHLRECLTRKAPWDGRRAALAEESSPHAITPPGCSYFFISSGGMNFAFRWFQFDTGGTIAMSADQGNDDQVDALSIVPGALATWNSPSLPNASLNVRYGGPVPVAPNCASPDPFTMRGRIDNTIVFNDPCNAIPDLTASGGVLAEGGLRAGLGGGVMATRYPVDECAFWARIETWYVLVNNNIVGPFGIPNLATYQLALAHELGHGLGFDHVADPNALMNGSCCHALNATDITCAQFAYARLAGGIAVSIPALDFGTVNAGASPSLPLNIRSVGTADLNVTSMTLAAGTAPEFSLTAPPSALVSPCAADPSFTIQVTYRPTAAGTHNGTLVIRSNDPDSSPLNIPLTGRSIASEIEVTPAAVDVGNVRVGMQATRSVTIRNLGTAVLNVTSIALQFGNRGFTRTAGPTNAVLNPNASVMVDVTFAPTATGLRSDSLVVRSNDADESTVNVALSGTGVAPMLEVTPPSLAFGDVSQGGSRLLMATLRNTGSAALSVTAISLNPGTSAEFSLAGPSTANLAPGLSQSVGVTYSPANVGPDMGGLRIQSDDPTRPDLVVPLSGNGLDLPGGTQIPGDCNQDGSLDISDAICLIGFLFLGAPVQLPCGDPGPPEPDGPSGQADIALMNWNGDAQIDLSDAIGALGALFLGRPPHVLDVSGTGRSCVRILGCPSVCSP